MEETKNATANYLNNSDNINLKEVFDKSIATYKESLSKPLEDAMSPLLEKIKEQEVLLGMYDRRVKELEEEGNNITSDTGLQGNINSKLLDGMIDVVCRAGVENKDIKANNLTLTDLVATTTEVAENFLEYKREMEVHKDEIEEELDKTYSDTFDAIRGLTSEYTDLRNHLDNINSELNNDIDADISNILDNINELRYTLENLTEY